jgi:16S rRNA (cytidine1402-2'-O)-methyltransferase
MLFIVSTPIGNRDDITLRAQRVLREANAVICEERGTGGRILHDYKIENELLDLNEHNERERIPELIDRLKNGETLALISDHGTPLLADPGGQLVRRAIAEGIAVSAAPGPSALLAALVVAGLAVQRFRFVGLLPAKTADRRAELNRLRDEPDTWAVMDAPYRLQQVLTDLLAAVGPARRIAVACNLTMPEEQIVRGTAGLVVEQFRSTPFKGEFVIVVEGKGHR